jgi:hypothetical protein
MFSFNKSQTKKEDEEDGKEEDDDDDKGDGYIIVLMPVIWHGLFSIFRRISHLCDVFLSKS